MIREDRKRFAELMAVLGEVFQKEVSKPLMTIYFEALKDYPILQIEKAVNHILLTRTITGTIPMIAELVAAMTGSVEDRAELAWTALLWGIEHVGHPDSVQFEDQVIHDTVEALGGWLRVCSADDDQFNEDWFTKNLTWRHKDFISMYKIMAASGGRNLPYLKGLLELENEKFDYSPPIIRITGKAGQYEKLAAREQIENAKVLALPEKIGGIHDNSSGNDRKVI